MPKFKIGDKVYVRRNVETGIEKGMVDFNKVYTIIGQWWSGAYKLDGLGIYGFSDDWLLPAKCEVKVNEGRIKDVKFSGPATIVFWTDGTKTVVKCRKGDKFDPEKGIAMACAKKLLGNEDGYHKEIAKRIDSAAAKTLREEAYRLCGKTVCAKCPLKAMSGECPNFLSLNVSQLRKFVSLLREAQKHGDS